MLTCGIPPLPGIERSAEARSGGVGTIGYGSDGYVKPDGDFLIRQVLDMQKVQHVLELLWKAVQERQELAEFLSGDCLFARAWRLGGHRDCRTLFFGLVVDAYQAGAIRLSVDIAYVILLNSDKPRLERLFDIEARKPLDHPPPDLRHGVLNIVMR